MPTNHLSLPIHWHFSKKNVLNLFAGGSAPSIANEHVTSLRPASARRISMRRAFAMPVEPFGSGIRSRSILLQKRTGAAVPSGGKHDHASGPNDIHGPSLDGTDSSMKTPGCLSRNDDRPSLFGRTDLFKSEARISSQRGHENGLHLLFASSISPADSPPLDAPGSLVWCLSVALST